jgi:hypothetical protein
MLKNCAKRHQRSAKTRRCVQKNKQRKYQSSEIKSEVRQVLNYIITEVCNEVEIDNPSKTKEVSSPQALITHS